MLQTILLVIHVLVAISLITLVLVQHGKGADIGATFGSGASNTMFGSQGSGSFLFKVTGVLAAIFFITSLALGYYASHAYKTRTHMAAQITKQINNTAAPVTGTKKV